MSYFVTFINNMDENLKLLVLSTISLQKKFLTHRYHNLPKQLTVKINGKNHVKLNKRNAYKTNFSINLNQNNFVFYIATCEIWSWDCKNTFFRYFHSCGSAHNKKLFKQNSHLMSRF